ncbi:MAG: 1-deoxy-D-xylulose-5-phosphate synthase N-terminal domain-containing protein, partial [Oscillospiraceae bacterium]
LVIILNHNEMSISKNVGGFSRYLTTIRAKPWYLKLKSGTEKVLDHTPIIGKPIKHWLESSKSLLKTLIYRSTFFEYMGFSFLGPVNGHNFKELLDVLNRAKDLRKPVVVQVETIKGKGYPPAEQNPGEYHSTGAFDKNIGVLPKISDSYSDQAGKYLVELASKNNKICAITAAMKYGTGLNYFSKAYKERFFDVGIAEQHAVTFAGGLASQGLIPVFAVYSSFLQRSYDQVLHDLAIDNQHICLLIDRAGIVGEDGETHQGIFDVAMLSNIPNVTIYSPEGYEELKLCMEQAILKDSGIACVRYPRGKEEIKHNISANTEFSYIDKTNDAEKTNSLTISYGRLFSNCINCKTSLLKLTKIHPIPKEAIKIAMQYDNIIFVEEGIKQGSVASSFGLALLENGYKGSYKINAINNFVRHGKVSKLLEELKLDEKSIIERNF